MGGQGCQEPSTFSIPHILNLEVATAYDSDELVYEQMLGIVTEEADRLVVKFESGDTIDLVPGKEARLGYRGFGSTDFDVSRLGEPVTVEVFDGDTSLGVYSHELGRSTESGS